MSKPSNPDQWTTINAGAATQIKFDTIGDVFIGTLLGSRTITPEHDEPFDVWEFEATEQDGLADGELVNLSQSYALRDLGNVATGTLCRIEYLKDVPTAKGLNPMKSFLIQVKA
jgi:hypothetical protein